MQRRNRVACLPMRLHHTERDFFIDEPTGPNPLDHRDDLVDRPRVMAVCIPISR